MVEYVVGDEAGVGLTDDGVLALVVLGTGGGGAEGKGKRGNEGGAAGVDDGAGGVEDMGYGEEGTRGGEEGHGVLRQCQQILLLRDYACSNWGLT